MSGPAIFNGRRTKLLTADGILTNTGAVIDYNGQQTYIANGHAEVNTNGWTISKNTSATAAPDSGFVTTSTSNTWARNTSSPIGGQADFLYTLAALGNQVYYDFTIDAKDKGKVLQGLLEYKISSGTYADDSVAIWVYDVTNAAFIQPAPYLVKNHSLAAERMPFEFQTSSSSVSYRLVLHQAAASTAALQIKNVQIGPQAKLYGSPVTDWVSFTPTGSWSTNTTYTGKWRRVGDSAEIDVSLALSGAPTAANLTVNMPSGMTIDTSKQAQVSSAAFGTIHTVSAGAGYFGVVDYSSTTAVRALITGASGTYTTIPALISNTVPATYANGDYVSLRFKVPITGWSSSVIMSSDAATNVVAAKYYGTQTTSMTSGTAYALDFPTKSIDTNGAWTSTGSHNSTLASGSKYTVAVPGVYRVTAAVILNETTNNFNGTTEYFDLTVYKNGSSDSILQSGRPFVNQQYPTRNGSALVNCAAGDTLQIVSIQTSGVSLAMLSDNVLNHVSIERISGPAQIAASDTVAVRAFLSSDQTGVNPNASLVKVNIDSTSSAGNGFDTNGSWASSKFTAPISGKYSVSAVISLLGTNVLANSYQAGIYKNGVGYSYGPTSQVNAGSTVWVGIQDTVNLLAGEYIEIYFYGQGNNSASTLTIDGATAGDRTYVSITRVGNY